jgi:beta,beta-carotene 9',10'-dioxygenase
MAWPLAFRFGAKAYKDNFRWDPGSGSALHALPLDGGAVRSWTIPALMCFHATQAWAEGDDLLVELATYADASVFDDLLLERRRADAPLAQAPCLQRYRLRSGRSDAEVQDLGVSMELQQVRPDTIGQRRARVCWGMAASDQGRFLDHVLRLDLDSGAASTWQRPQACHLEPLFVARPGGSADDAGVLLVPTLSEGDAASVLAIDDAATMSCLAEVDAPQVIPFGFHAAFRHEGG